MTETSLAHPLGVSRLDRSSWSALAWAPRCDALALRLIEDGGERDVALDALGRGYFGAVVELAAGTTYRFVLPDGQALPDPASRRQPSGVHGPSAAFDPADFVWTDDGFRAPDLDRSIIYELHVGTFTEAGTFDAAIERLDDLRALGVTTVEPLPIAAFPGSRN
ncbi:MAG: hypothetical protein JO246_18750, partial [Frankiaceae bacterium]|nr:hypothetical protein [Frankiaceae bacterium]